MYGVFLLGSIYVYACKNFFLVATFYIFLLFVKFKIIIMGILKLAIKKIKLSDIILKK